MIDRHLLRYFLAVVDHGNFSRAADHCRVAQPTLSAGIARLEGLLGRILFNRTNRRVELTGAGARFAPHARRIEAGFAEAEQAVRDDVPAATLRIGVASTVPAEWIADALAQAREEPAPRIEIVAARPRDVRALLDRGRVDAVIGVADDGWRGADTLFGEGYALAFPAGHPLAGRTEIRAEEVAGETMLVRRQCEVLADVSRHFTAHGVRPFMAARTTSDEHAVAFVRARIGITVMPRCYAAPGIAMVDFAGFTARRTIALLIDPPCAADARRAALLGRMAQALRQRHADHMRAAGRGHGPPASGG